MIERLYSPQMQVLSVDRSRNVLTHGIVSDRRNRYGRVVHLDGLVLPPNGVRVMAQHGFSGRDLPLGKCLGTAIDTFRGVNIIAAQTEFYTPGVEGVTDQYPLLVMDMHVQGVLNGWSIGFDPVQYSERREPPEGKPDDEPILTLHVEKWELLEYSSVDIPADPYAMTQALESAVKTGRLTQEQIDGWRGRQCRGCGRCQEPPETQQPAKQPAEAAVDPLTAFGRLTVTTQRRV